MPDEKETRILGPPFIGGRLVISYDGEGSYLPRCIEHFANSNEGLDFLARFRPLDTEKWNPEKTKANFIQMPGLEGCLNLCGHKSDSIDPKSLWDYLYFCFDVRNVFSIYSNAYIAYNPKSSS